MKILGLGIMMMLVACTTSSFDLYDIPPQYKHPYRGNLILIKPDSDYAAAQECGKANAYACAKPGVRSCIVVLGPSARVYYDKALEHEVAHCNGWRH